MLGSDNDKHGTSRLIKTFAIAATAVAVASSAIVGTVAAQTSRLFDDVPRGHYAYSAIEWAAENGITEGCGDGTNFCPTKTLNRAQMVTFLKRYHDKFGTSGGTGSTGSSQSVNDEDDGVVVTFSGTGSDLTRSVRVTEGPWRVDFRVEHDTRLGQLTLVASDEDDTEVLLIDEVLTGDDYRQSVQIRVRSGHLVLEPGRIWFDVDTRNDAEWTIILTELTSGGTGSTGSSQSVNDEDDEDDGVVVTFSGTGSDLTRSVRVTEGPWRVDFRVEHDTRLGQLTLVASDEDGTEVLLIDEVLTGDDYRQSVQIRVRSGLLVLEPGRIWFDVDTRNDAEWTIILTEL